MDESEHVRGAVVQRGIDLVLRIVAPDGRFLDTVDSPNGMHGPEPFAITATSNGVYTLEIESLVPGVPAGSYTATLEERLTRAQHAARMEQIRLRDEGVVRWIRNRALPLATVEAGNGFDDLLPLRDVLKDARIVALGEATHGSREFFQFKHRMLEFLVREMGFRIFAIEASHAGCEVINDYVMGRTDDGAAALRAQGFWTWDTEEVRGMIDWMREYNAAVPEADRVSFVGFDLQVNERAYAHLAAFLRRLKHPKLERLEKLPRPGNTFARNDVADAVIEALVARAVAEDDSVRAAAARAALDETRSFYASLITSLENERTALSAATDSIDAAIQSARVIWQYLDSYFPGASWSLRDTYMAENMRRLVERSAPGSRFVMWAHNGHISQRRTPASDGSLYEPMGALLHDWYGEAYYALGFAFNRGDFQSRDAHPGGGNALTRFTVDAAEAGSVEWYLAQSGHPMAIIDLKGAMEDRDASWWSGNERPMRSIGSRYNRDWPSGGGGGPSLLSKEYDGIFYIDRTTRARPNPGVQNVAREE